MKRSQAGFSVVEAVLIFVIVAIIGGTGYYVWHSTSQTSKSLTNDTSATPKVTQKVAVVSFNQCKAAIGSKMLETYPEQCVTKDGKTFTDTSQSATKYVVIKEWGVKAPYSGNVTLEYKPDSVDASNTIVRFSSVELDATASACKSHPEYGGLIVRYASSDEYLIGDEGADSGKTAAEYAATLSADTYGHVGNYYYFYTSPQGACGASSQSQDLQSQTNSAVKSLLTKLTAS